MTDSPRIAYLTSAYARPSDTYIRNEVNQLRKLGVDVVTFSIRRPEIGSDAEDDVRQHQGTTEYLLESGIGRVVCRALVQAVSHPLQFLRTVPLAWNTSAPGVRGVLLQAAYLSEALYLASMLLERKIDLLHNHIGENSATVAMLAADFSGIPFSQTIHGPYIFYGPQRWALGTKIDRSAFTACISYFCRSQCMVFAPEEAWRRLHVVRCSVQPEFFDMPQTPDFPNEPHFVCVGRLCGEKGQAVLLEAAGNLLRSGHRVSVSLVGDGPSRASLERRIGELNIQEHVKVLGWQSSAKIRELLQQATALVIPSFAEGLPIVAMEALAMGRPVIATSIAAMSELIEDGESGWLIPASSVDDLGESLKAASECGPAKLQAMGERGRKRVLELHHPVRQAEQLRSLFLEAIQNGHRHSANPTRI